MCLDRELNLKAELKKLPVDKKGYIKLWKCYNVRDDDTFLPWSNFGRNCRIYGNR